MKKWALTVGLIVGLTGLASSGEAGMWISKDGEQMPVEYLRVASLTKDGQSTHLIQPVYEEKAHKTLGLIVPLEGGQSVELVSNRFAPFLALSSATAPERAVQAKGKRCSPPLPESADPCCDEQMLPSQEKTGAHEPATADEAVAVVECDEVKPWLEARGWKGVADVKRMCVGAQRALVAVMQRRPGNPSFEWRPVRLKMEENPETLPVRVGVDTQVVLWLLGEARRVKGRPQVRTHGFVETQRQDWPSVYAQAVSGLWKEHPEAVIVEFKGQISVHEAVWNALASGDSKEGAKSVLRLRMRGTETGTIRYEPAKAQEGEAYRAGSVARRDNPTGRCEASGEEGWVEGYTQKAGDGEIWRALQSNGATSPTMWRSVDKTGAPLSATNGAEEQTTPEREGGEDGGRESRAAKKATPEQDGKSGCQTSGRASVEAPWKVCLIGLGVMGWRRARKR
jgi:hypothetical protein